MLVTSILGLKGTEGEQAALHKDTGPNSVFCVWGLEVAWGSAEVCEIAVGRKLSVKYDNPKRGNDKEEHLERVLENMEEMDCEEGRKFEKVLQRARDIESKR